MADGGAERSALCRFVGNDRVDETRGFGMMGILAGRWMSALCGFVVRLRSGFSARSGGGLLTD